MIPNKNSSTSSSSTSADAASLTHNKNVKEPTLGRTTTSRPASGASSIHGFILPNENEIPLEILPAQDNASPNDNEPAPIVGSSEASTLAVPQAMPENIDWVEWYRSQDSTISDTAGSSGPR